MESAVPPRAPTPTILRLEEFLPFRLSRLSNTISAGISATYTHRHHLSVTEWRVIAIAGRFPGLSARGITVKGALDKVSVSRAVSRLVGHDLMTRSVDPEDRRRSVLKLSAAGRAIYRRIAPAAIAYEQRLLAALDPVEREALDRALDKLWQRAQELEQARPVAES